jgi:hypothetical protein
MGISCVGAIRRGMARAKKPKFYGAERKSVSLPQWSFLSVGAEYGFNRH